jgi:hypothetical protein
VADRIVEISVDDISIDTDPTNPNGWVTTSTAILAPQTGVAGVAGDRVQARVQVLPTDTIATWQAKRRDAYRAAIGKPTVPCLMLQYALG